MAPLKCVASGFTRRVGLGALSKGEFRLYKDIRALGFRVKILLGGSGGRRQ